jgi:hypothetical protein
MNAIRVMIIDDDTQRANSWSDGIAELGVPSLKLEVPTNAEVAETIKALNVRRLKARKNENWRDQQCRIDGADILLIDFDLIEFHGDSGESTTGEELAYLARLFSTANVICVVNQFGINRFDLTLETDATRKNDLDLGSEQIVNPGLWKRREAWKGFRPWHWPVLTDEVEFYQRRLLDVSDNLASPVLEYFGFDSTGQKPGRSPSSKTLSFFQGDPQIVTFAAVAESSVFVHPKDVEWLKSDEQQLARVSAAVIQKWLKKYVLIRQDVLVDVPHLISRKPWLLSNFKDPGVWPKSTGPDASSILIADVQKYRFEREHWVGRPVYWGEEINADPRLALPDEKWRYEDVPDLVFREDTSSFGNPTTSRDFDCELGTSYDTRYVAEPEKEEKHDGAIDLRKVQYVPISKLMT